jgi:hypothetical protein
MRRIAALLAVVLLGACTHEIDQSTRPASVTGTYQLHTYGGRSLPVVVSTDASGVWEIVSGQLIIGNDQSWSETVDYRVTKGTKVVTTSVGSSGSWTFMRDFAYMMFNDKVYNYQFTGTAAGGSVTLDLVDGNALVYSR